MNETGINNSTFTGYSGTYSGTSATTTAFYTPIAVSGNSPLTFSNSLGLTIKTPVKNMTPKQVHVAVFTITRDEDTNEINSTKFVKELWVEQKNGTSIDLIVAKQLGYDFDPEFTIIRVLLSVSF